MPTWALMTPPLPCPVLPSGCPALVVALWDVTDRDIDRFCEALLSSWLGHKEAGQQGQGQAQGRQAARGADEAGPCPGRGALSMSAAVSSSRAACKLPHLIGAAPVCYGIPTQVGWGTA